MKKFMVTALLLIAVLFSLTACGNNTAGDNTESIEKESHEVIELTPDSNIVRTGSYEISGLFTDILSEKSVSEGWYYYYSSGTEDKVPWAKWEHAEGMYTSCELLFNYKNLDKKAQKSTTDRFSGVIVYNYPKDINLKEKLDDGYIEYLQNLAKTNPGMELYKLTPMQDNPNQKDLDGYQARSKDAKILELYQEAKQSLIADVSKAFYDSWANRGQEEMWAFFSYDDDVTYAVNLRKYMEEFK